MQKVALLTFDIEEFGSSDKPFEITYNGLKKIWEKIFGFRAPVFQRPNYDILRKLGFLYDSSVNPTFIPGNYNYFFNSRKIKNHNGLYVVPLSVSPIVRLPLFWVAFRVLGLIYAKIVTMLNFIDLKFVHLVFHSWEFVDLENDKNLPFLYRKNSGKKLESMLVNYIKWLKAKNVNFITIKEYLK
jgi:hypothetical protein